MFFIIQTIYFLISSYLLSSTLFLLLLYLTNNFITKQHEDYKLLHRPKTLIFPLLCLLFGIYVQKQVDLSWISSLLITLASTGSFLLTTTTTKSFTRPFISYLLAVFSIGILTLSTQTSLYRQEQKCLPKGKTTIIATVIEKTERDSSNKLLLQMPTKLFCYNSEPTSLRAGDVIKLKNVRLQIPKQKTSLSGNTSFCDYLISQGVCATLFLKRPDYKILTTKRNFSLWLANKRAAMFESLKSKMQPKTFSLFSSIFLGNKNETITAATKTKFGYWCILHQLARSGLHIAIFIAVWTIILSFVPLPIIMRLLILIFLTLLYAMLSWPGISFFRALWLYMLYQLGVILNKQTNLFYLIFVITILFLCINPMQLFSLGFQLSFGLTIALILSFL